MLFSLTQTDNEISDIAMKRKQKINSFNPKSKPLIGKKREVSSVLVAVEDLPEDLPKKRLVSYTIGGHKAGGETFTVDKIEIIKEGLFRLKVDNQEKFLEVQAGTLIRVY